MPQTHTDTSVSLAEGCWAEANYDVTCDFLQPKRLLVQVSSQQHAAWVQISVSLIPHCLQSHFKCVPCLLYDRWSS